MKQGSSIEKFAEQLYNQAKTKRDFVVDTRSLRLHTSDTGRQEIAVSEVEWSLEKTVFTKSPITLASKLLHVWESQLNTSNVWQKMHLVYSKTM